MLQELRARGSRKVDKWKRESGNAGGKGREHNKWVRNRVMHFRLSLNGLTISGNAHMQTVRKYCACLNTDFCGHFCISYLLPDCLSCSASIILQPWRYEKQEAIFSVKWVETQTLTISLTQAHSRWAQPYVTSVTLKTALKHVLELLVIEVGRNKQPHSAVLLS